MALTENMIDYDDFMSRGLDPTEFVTVHNPKNPWGRPLGYRPIIKAEGRYAPQGNPKSRKSKVKCKSCNACRGNPAMRDRYYKAWFDRSPGDETLEMIGKELGISNQAIYRHAHNHMKKKVHKIQATTRVIQEAIDLKAQSMKELEVSFDHDLVIPKEDYEAAVDAVITDGLAQMRVKGKDITINQILAAAKIKGDWKAKKRGQDTELIKMMYRSASGFKPTPES